MQKLGRGDISELWKPPRIESFPNRHCPTCGELIPLTSPTKLFGYGSVRSLDTAASLDCPSCSLQLQERPRKRPSTERMLLPEVAKTVHSRASSGSLLLKSSLLLGTLGLGIYFWPQLQSWIPHKYLAIFPLAVESPILQVKSEPIGAIVRIDGQVVGTTPLAMANLYPAGPVRVTLTLKGHKNWTGQFAGAARVVVAARLSRR